MAKKPKVDFDWTVVYFDSEGVPGDTVSDRTLDELLTFAPAPGEEHVGASLILTVFPLDGGEDRYKVDGNGRFRGEPPALRYRRELLKAMRHERWPLFVYTGGADTP